MVQSGTHLLTMVPACAPTKSSALQTVAARQAVLRPDMQKPGSHILKEYQPALLCLISNYDRHGDWSLLHLSSLFSGIQSQSK